MRWQPRTRDFQDWENLPHEPGPIPKLLRPLDSDGLPTSLSPDRCLSRAVRCTPVKRGRSKKSGRVDIGSLSSGFPNWIALVLVGENGKPILSLITKSTPPVKLIFRATTKSTRVLSFIHLVEHASGKHHFFPFRPN